MRIGPLLPKPNSFLAILILAVGTAVAVALIPEEVQPKAALFWPSLALAVALGGVPIWISIQEPKRLFEAQHLLVLAPIYWLLLDSLQKVYDLEGISHREAVLAFVSIALFTFGVWLGVMGRSWPIPRLVHEAASMEVTSNTLFTISVMAFLLGMGKFAIPCGFDISVMLKALMANRWEAPWCRGALGGWNAFSDALQYFGYLLPAVTVTLASRLGWLNTRTIGSLLMAVIITVFMAQEGGRRNVGVMVGMAIICWVLMNKRVKSRQLTVIVVMCGLLLWLMQTMLTYRNTGFQSLVSAEERQAIEMRDYIHVDDNFYRLCQIVQFIPRDHPFVYGKFITYVLVRPIPRVFWPGKPTDAGFDIAEEQGLKGVSLSISVVGEMYMSGGLLAVLLGGWFYGRLAGMANQLLAQTKKIGAVILYGTMTMALFAGMRSFIDLILISYVIIAWVILSRMYQMAFGGSQTRLLAKKNRKAA
jgi:oligosaccharide repeat unit polymerase